MPAYDRHKLHFGPYRTPAFRYGEKAECESRGEVTIIGISDARIPWPIGWLPGGKSPVLFGSLVNAVRREAACAVAHWWGVSKSLVRKWRRALDVPRWNEGDLLRNSASGKSPAMKPALQAMWAKAQDPERRAKIAAAKRGKPRPPEVVEGMRRRMLGKRLPKATRAKMSAAQKRRGTRPPWLNKPWEPWEDQLCRTVRPAEVVKQTGRTMDAVLSHRQELGLPDGRTRKERERLSRHTVA